MCSNREWIYIDFVETLYILVYQSLYLLKRYQFQAKMLNFYHSQGNSTLRLRSNSDRYTTRILFSGFFTNMWCCDIMYCGCSLNRNTFGLLQCVFVVFYWMNIREQLSTTNQITIKEYKIIPSLKQFKQNEYNDSKWLY